jgi:hypothetical protein
MSGERMPYQIVDDLAAVRAGLSDAEVLAELADARRVRRCSTALGR